MSDIPPVVGPPLSPREDPDELRLFNEVTSKPLEIIQEMGEGQTLQLTSPHRFTVAQLCASKNAGITASRIHLFVLNQENSFEIAKICFENDPDETLENILKFNLTSNQRLELTKEYMEDEDFNLWENFEKFGLENEDRFELAELCLQNGYSISEHIANFDLTREQRFQLALKYMQQRGGSILNWIQHLDLSPDQNFEIAQMCIQNFHVNPSLLVENIRNLKLSENQSLEILSYAVGQDPRFLNPILQEHGIAQCTAILSAMGLLDPKQAMEWVNLGLDEQKILMTRAGNILLNWQRVTPDEMRWFASQGWLGSILDFPVSYLDNVLAGLAIEIAENPASYNKLLKKFPPFLCIPLAKLQDEGVDIEKLELNQKDLKNSKKFIPFLQSMIYLSEDDFADKTRIIEIMTKKTTDINQQTNTLREEMVELQQRLTFLSRELATLSEAGALSKEELVQRQEEIDTKKTDLAQKRAILDQLKKDIYTARNYTFDSARDLATIFGCDRSELLRKRHLVDVINFNKLALQAFESILPLPEEVDNFLMHYERTFGSYRIPKALQMYAANLNKEGSCAPALRCLGAHVISVFNGTYLSERYDTSKNPHLQRLEQYDPNLLGLWQRNSKEALSSGFSLHETDNAEDILLCGTEVTQSCQSVTADPKQSQGLVGYLRNGQTRLLAIKDNKGQIVARCLLRLLWDDKAEKPVLFLEKFYSNANNPAFHDALIKKAKRTASRLNCPLTSKNLPQDEYNDYPHPIQSLGGAAPCEYVDAAEGLKEGPYTINRAQLLPADLAAAE